MRIKVLDAVEMKHAAAAELYKTLASLPPAEQLRFWQERTRALREYQKAIQLQKDETPTQDLLVALS